MKHADHVRLLSRGVKAGGVWADLGAGTGAFTLALAELLGPGGSIYAVDRDGGALATLERAVRQTYPATQLHVLPGDFTGPLQLPALDGIVMANSLHFQRRREETIRHVRGWLKPGGRLLLVEYNVDRGNLWVPHPLSFETWRSLAGRLGFSETRLLDTQPSSFLHEFYAALSW